MGHDGATARASASDAAGAATAADRGLAPYLAATWFLDSDDADVAAYARAAAAGARDDVDLAKRLYYAVRDDIRYDPYGIDTTRAGFRASACLARRAGFCITKAALLAARLPAFEAAGLAAWWHGAAADRCDQARVGFGLLASELADALPICASEILERDAYRAAEGEPDEVLELRFPGR